MDRGWRRGLLGGVFAISLLLVGCGGKKERAVERPRVQADTARVKAYEIPMVREFPGRVEARGELTLASKVAGYVREVRVEEGQRVKKGQLLLILDDKDVRARIRALEETRKALEKQKAALASRLAYAQANFRRYALLLKEKAVTQEEFDKVRSQYQALVEEEKALEYRIKGIRSQTQALAQTLRYTVIRAPYGGVVTARRVDPGTYVSPGTPLLTLESPGAGYWFVAQVDEAYLSRLKSGEVVFLYIKPLGEAYRARLDRVVPWVNPHTGGFKVKVDVSSFPVRSGMFGKLYLVVDKARRVLIPWRAVVRRGNLDAVYTVDQGNVVHFRIIRTGRSYKRAGNEWMPVATSQEALRRGLWVEVLGGLDPGERLVVSNLDEMREGVSLER